jgi:hypothetical protein
VLHHRRSRKLLPAEKHHRHHHIRSVPIRVGPPVLLPLRTTVRKRMTKGPLQFMCWHRSTQQGAHKSCPEGIPHHPRSQGHLRRCMCPGRRHRNGRAPHHGRCCIQPCPHQQSPHGRSRYRKLVQFTSGAAPFLHSSSPGQQLSFLVSTNRRVAVGNRKTRMYLSCTSHSMHYRHISRSTYNRNRHQQATHHFARNNH